MTYSAFPISDFKTGYYDNKEPWLAPGDAFTTLQNTYIKRGVLQKRKGYSEFAQMTHYNSTITGATQADPCNITSASHGLSDGTTVLIYGVVGMTELNGNEYTVANSTTNTFELSGIDSSAYTAYSSGGKIATFQTNPIMGIHEYMKSDGTKQLVVCDTDRCAYYDTSINYLIDINEADDYTGDSTDFFWFGDYEGKAWISNGVDRVRTWDGTTDAQPDFDIDGDTNNEVTKAKLIYPFKRRLLLFNTTESGTDYPQRVRWSKLADTSTWDDTISDGGGFVDAPTSDHIVTAQFVKDLIIVFFSKSTWLLRFTGDLDLPFRWERIDSSKKVQGKHGSVNYLNTVWAYGPSGFVQSNGATLTAFNDKVPDITLDLDLGNADQVFMQRFDEYEQIWMLHPKEGSSTSDEAFVYNYEENTWAKYDMPMITMGATETINDITWDGESRTWDEINDTWNDFGFQSAYPFILGGSSGGYLYKINDTGEDDGAAITSTIESKRFNPYAEAGYNAKLGWIDFLVSADDDNQLELELYLDFSTTPYQTTTLTFDSASGGQKVWKRIHSGAVGASHRFQLSHTASNQTFKIHAIIPYFEQAGELNG